MSFTLTYETIKYVNIKDARLAVLRGFLLLAIIVYVGVFEMWGQGGWLETSQVVGAVRFSLQQPTVNDCDPNEETCNNAFENLSSLQYCRQDSESSYTGNTYPCEIYEATNAQIVSEKSMAIITRASTREEELVCGQDDLVCGRTYNSTSEGHKFYTAQSEAFSIMFDHAVTASKVCTQRNNYACSSESAKYHGRLYSKNGHLCAQAFANSNAYQNVRGRTRRREAPCYLSPNRTVHGQDFFSLDVLLKAVNVSLDDCNLALSQDGDCQTYRETGATILLNIYWSDFETYHGMVEPYYYYSANFLAGSTFKQNIPFYHSYRSSRTLLNAHGIRVAVLLGGEYHQFNVVSFLVTLTTALGLLAVATTIVDALMLYILPEKERYQQAKYEEEGPEVEVDEDVDLHDDMLETGYEANEDEGSNLNEPLLQEL
jgi:hypothetical protein